MYIKIYLYKEMENIEKISKKYQKNIKKNIKKILKKG